MAGSSSDPFECRRYVPPFKRKQQKEGLYKADTCLTIPPPPPPKKIKCKKQNTQNMSCFKDETYIVGLP